MISKSFSDELLFRYGHARRRLPFLLRRPLSVFLYITGACDLDCSYCWQREQLLSISPFVDSSRAPFRPEEWVKVVNNLASPSLLGISGGEPTISAAFAPVVAATRGRHLITVNSNAAQWKDPHFDILTEPHVRNVSVSLDGFAGTHDRNRNSPGLFDKVCNNLRRLKALRTGGRRPTITIKMVLSDDMVGRLREFRAFCTKELGASALNVSLRKEGDHHQWSLLHCDDPERIWTGDAHLYGYAQPDRIVDEISQLWDEDSRRCPVVLFPRISDPATLRRFLTDGGRSGYAPCALPRALITVLPDGQVIPCQSQALGNVRDAGYSVAEVLRKRPYQDVLNRIDSFGSALPPVCHVCCFAKVARA